VPGSGTTSLLCYLAATRPYPVWLPEDDAGGGLEALCAQLLALHNLPAPLVPPAAARDATTVERLLAEAAARRPPGDPLIVLIDRPPDRHDAPLSPPFPAVIPPGAVVVLASSPQAGTTGLLGTRVALPVKSARTTRRLAQAAAQLGRSPEAAKEIAAAANGSFLYVRIAIGLLESGLLLAGELPAGLEALHERWWGQLDQTDRRLATVLAAVGEPIDPLLLATVARVELIEVRRSLLRWRGLIEAGERVRLYHSSTRDSIATRVGDDLASAHAAYVELARIRAGGQFESLSPISDGYLVRQLARHAALSAPATRTDAAMQLTSRAWVRARERHSNDLRAAAHDATWTLRAITHESPPLELVRAAALAGTLTLLARSLPPDALAEAFLATLARGGARDETLRRARAMLEQLPENHDKALVLRRLGEACYAQNMRTPAMRMLSEALDLEAPGLPRVWRDEREEALVAFARAAVTIDTTDTALGITAQIGHAERRGLVETEVVRWLLAHGQRTRAEEVAYAIGHQAMHEWAMAEVAVGHVRAGDSARAEVVLSTLKTETAIAWALAELASDAAHHGDPLAIDRVAALANQRLRDRALALVAQALAAGQQPDLALATARMAGDREVRARALIDLSLQRLPNSAVALAHAAEDVAVLADDERAPLVAALAAAQAAAGQAEAGLATANTLPEGEERDRAQSRVAVALARNDAAVEGCRVAQGIVDDDERDWALDEISRILAGQGDWGAAFALTAHITDAQQRARTEVDLVIAWARAGHGAEAHEQAAQIALATERQRAQAAIVEALIVQGGRNIALATLTQLHEPTIRSRYQAALAAALAAHGELVAAHGMARAVPRPLDRARALTTIAWHSAGIDADQSQLALGEALRVAAALGRKETFFCLVWAAETLAALGGAELLLAATSALDEVDSWWNY
jgi:tetratricopeptide (TPR) repeat protein